MSPQSQSHAHAQPHQHPHLHQHANIVPNFLPTLSTFRRYLKDGGWLEMRGDTEWIKYARAGHFVYVPRAGVTGYASYMRMALLQTAIADDLIIRLELPDAMR